jgi:hypothetical protein
VDCGPTGLKYTLLYKYYNSYKSAFRYQTDTVIIIIIIDNIIIKRANVSIHRFPLLKPLWIIVFRLIIYFHLNIVITVYRWLI